MQFAPSISAIGVRQSAPRAAASHPRRLEPIDAAHPLRAECEQFIGTRFFAAYAARVTRFSPYLLGLRDALGHFCAAVGYTPAEGRRLYLEQYLDAPVEQLLAPRGVARHSIVEVGHLAASTAGLGRALIPLLAQHLHRLGYLWVVFTATRELRNAFARLGLTPLELAVAEPARLPDGGARWGSYYEHAPVVVAGRIALGVTAGRALADRA
jgi:hypothetical protein